MSTIVEEFGIQGRGLGLALLSLIGPFIAILLAFNRFYWRYLKKTFGIDDVCLLLAALFLSVQCIANVLAVSWGYGTPFDYLELKNVLMSLKFFWIEQIFYKLTINFSKLSMLFLYMRVFADHIWFVKACWGLVAVVVFACTAFTTATIIQCLPMTYIWDRFTTQGHCVNFLAFWYANAIYNITTDIIIVVMVPPIVWYMNMPVREKLGLIVMLCLGIFTCMAAIFRLTTLYDSAYGSDATAGTLTSTVWTTIESELGVICASLPMLRQTVMFFLPTRFRSRDNMPDDFESGNHLTSITPDHRSDQEIPFTNIPPPPPFTEHPFPADTPVLLGRVPNLDETHIEAEQRDLTRKAVFDGQRFVPQASQ